MDFDSVHSHDVEFGHWTNGQLCRVCGTLSDYLIPIFEGEGLKHSLDSKIRLYLPIQVTRDDVLPLHVCYNCTSAIMSWHVLYMSCHEADAKLHNLLVKQTEHVSVELDHLPEMSSSFHMLVPHSQPDQVCTLTHQPRIDLQGEFSSQDITQSSLMRNNGTSRVEPMSDSSVLQYSSRKSVLGTVMKPNVVSALASSLSGEDSFQEPALFLNVGTQTEGTEESLAAFSNPSTPTKKFGLTKRVLRNCSVVVKKKRTFQNTLITQETNAVSPQYCLEKSRPIFEDNDTTLSSRASAIQSTSSLSHTPTVKRSESVLVRNEAVWKESSVSKEDKPVQSQAVEPHLESHAPRQQCESYSILSGVSVVSFARPSCLRRAPTKGSENAATLSNCQEDTPEYYTSTTISSSSLQRAENYEGVIVGSPLGDVSSPVSTLEEDKEIDHSKTCFHCGKIINNLVLLHAHEKGHLCDLQPPTSFVCKFCFEPQSSFIDMFSHHAQHEAEAEKQKRNATNRRALLCKHCGQMCTTEEKLALHQRSHSDSIDTCTHTCKTCGESFHTRSKLSFHLWSHAIKPSQKVLKCHICGEGFSSKCAVLEHRLKHTEEERSHAFKCIICGMAFGNNTLLGKHRATHSEEELARPFKCSFCAKAFARNHTLQIHHLTHSDEKNHLCNQCGKGFKMRNSLIQHLRTHQDPSAWPSFPCQLCSKTFRVKSRLRDHLRLHNGEKPFICTTCGKRFHKITALHTHEVSHTERRPYMCDICGKAFKWSKNLRQHKAVHGDADKEPQGFLTEPKSKLKSKGQPCQCEVCGKQLAGRSSLRQHILNIHNGGTHKRGTATSCPVCGKHLSSAGGLARHMKMTHGGVKAFKCDLCDREYSTKVARDDHRRSHTGERPFTCNICPKTFTSLSNLHIHRTIHSEERPHKCTSCEKQFKRKAHLILHIRTHTGEKPYVCNICSRGFAQSNDLHKHYLTHSDNKAYACHCGMAFRLKRDLARHQIKFHPVPFNHPEEPNNQIFSHINALEHTTLSSQNHTIAVIQGQNYKSPSQMYSTRDSTPSTETPFEHTFTPSVLVHCSDVLLDMPN